jgi:hypothetical protein
MGRRSVSLLRLFCLLLVLTVFLSAYMYDMIQFDSEKVVIKIFPSPNLNENNINKKFPFRKSAESNDEHSRSNIRNDNSNYFNSPMDVNKLKGAELKRLPLRDANGNFMRSKQTLPDAVLRKLNAQVEDRNITNLFYKIDRFSNLIKQMLSSGEIEDIKFLRNKYEIAITERNQKIKEELKKEMEQNQQNMTNYSGNEYDSMLTQLSEEEPITRDLLVKFLKYEKYKLKLKFGNFKTIWDLISNYKKHKKLEAE